MSLPKFPQLPPETTTALVGLISHALKLDGKGSSALQSLASGLSDMVPDPQAAQAIKVNLSAARAEVQAAHDDFRDAARGRPPRA